MTEEQKRFKILKRTSYEEQITKESKTATIKALLFGFSAAAAALSLLLASQQDIESATKLFDLGLGFLNAGYSAYELKNLIQSISKKTMLQGKVEDINTELEMLENEESEGIRR